MSDLLPLPRPVAVAGFAGWNDAGSAATDAVVFMSSQLESTKIGSITAQDYCDFQVNRPQVRTTDQGERQLIWPDTELLEARLDGSKVLFIGGVEPSVRWRDYVDQLMGRITEWGAASLVTVGALLADVPHTRDIPIHASSLNQDLREVMGLDFPNYEGPVGIPTVLDMAAHYDHNLPSLALWAAVPHYVSTPPSPKAQLAMVNSLTQLLGTSVDLSDLTLDAQDWQEEVDQMASEDSDITQYVGRLEAAKDTMDNPASSGEALAKEFERYLRRRGNGQ